MTPCEILIKRGVTRLCHFTKFSSLTQIITSEDGILASNSIRSDIKDVTDVARYDGELDHICCSVEFPNSWFLKRAEQNNRDKIFRDWVVIYIKPVVLNARQAKYCPCNASKAYGSYICDKMQTVESIFDTNVPAFDYSRSQFMLSCCPTNGQAEILIKQNIPRKYFSGIAVNNIDMAQRVYSMLKMLDFKDLPIFISPDVFTKRWSELARVGRRPKEILFEGEEE